MRRSEADALEDGPCKDGERRQRRNRQRELERSNAFRMAVRRAAARRPVAGNDDAVRRRARAAVRDGAVSCGSHYGSCDLTPKIVPISAAIGETLGPPVFRA